MSVRLWTDNYIERILKARVYDVAHGIAAGSRRRACRAASATRVLLKREDLQPVFSFKLRGAYNKIAHLSESVARRGVICASAGNHAQGVALAAQRRGIPAVIVMPQTTPSIKVSAVRDLGGEVVLHGDDYDSAYEHAQSIVRERNLAFVHPFDDPDVIAGQGTIAVEILRQSRGELDAIFVPVGGGGLISGIAVYAKYLNPEDPDHRRRAGGCRGHARFTARQEARHARARRHLRRRRRGQDGSARKPSACAASTSTKSCWWTPTRSAPASRTCSKTRAPSSKARARSRSRASRSTARCNNWQDKRIVAINSGANMNFDQLRYVAERSDVGQAREALLAVEIPEQPGSFLRFCEMLGQPRRHRIQLPLSAARSARRSSWASACRAARKSATRSSQACAPPATASPT